jgi:hypothetical protein
MFQAEPIMSSDEKLDELLRRVGLMETGITNLGARMEALENDSTAKIITLISEMGAKLEKQANETAVEIRAEIMNLRAENDKNFRNLERRIAVVSDDINKVRADVLDLDERIDTLEKKPS